LKKYPLSGKSLLGYIQNVGKANRKEKHQRKAIKYKSSNLKNKLMTKRYYSKRYTKKRRIKYLVVGLILMFIALAVVSAYTDIPQLEPIRKQMEPFKRGIGVSKLSVGETGESDGLSITLVKGELNDGYTWFSWGSPSKVEPPEGAKFLFLYIKVKVVAE
jgi:hypothetical protein